MKYGVLSALKRALSAMMGLFWHLAQEHGVLAPHTEHGWGCIKKNYNWFYSLNEMTM